MSSEKPVWPPVIKSWARFFKNTKISWNNKDGAGVYSQCQNLVELSYQWNPPRRGISLVIHPVKLLCAPGHLLPETIIFWIRVVNSTSCLSILYRVRRWKLKGWFCRTYQFEQEQTNFPKSCKILRPLLSGVSKAWVLRQGVGYVRVSDLYPIHNDITR